MRNAEFAKQMAEMGAYFSRYAALLLETPEGLSKNASKEEVQSQVNYMEQKVEYLKTVGKLK